MLKERATSSKMAQLNLFRAIITTLCAVCFSAALIHPGAHGPSQYAALMLAIAQTCLALSIWPCVLDPELRRYQALSAEEHKRPENRKPVAYWISTAYTIAAFVLPALVFLWHLLHGHS